MGKLNYLLRLYIESHIYYHNFVISINSKFKIPDNVVFNRDGDKYVLVKTDNDDLDLFELQNEGLAIWEFIENESSCEKLIEHLKERYEFSENNVIDVFDFILELHKKELIIIES